MLQGSQFSFAPFLLDTKAKSLTRDGQSVALTPKLFDLLCLLVEHRGCVVEKEEIFRALWPDSFVEENNLTVNIAMLRKALGERAGQARWIETMPKRGYRFSAEVIEIPLNPPPALPSPTQHSSSAKLLSAYKNWALAIVAATFAAALGAFLYGANSSEPLKVVPLPGAEFMDSEPSLSPDGTKVAFVRGVSGTAEIFLRIIGTTSSVRISSSNLPSHAPQWSPDGKWIAYQRHVYPDEVRDERELVLVPSIGGPERSLGTFKSHMNVVKLSWTPDSEFVLINSNLHNSDPVAIEAVSLHGKQRRQLTQPPKGISGDISPAISPDGRTLAFARCITMAACYLHLVSLSNGMPTGEVKKIPSEPLYTPLISWDADGSSLVLSGGDWGVGQLYRLPIRFHRWPGELTRIDGVGELGSWPSLASLGRSGIQRLIYSRDSYDRNLWKLDLSSGNTEAVASTRRIEECVRVSPKGDRIAFCSTRSGSWEVWTCNIGGNNCSQVTDFGHGLCLWVSWSPDGNTLAFDSRRDGDPDIYIVSADGGPVKKLTVGKHAEVAPVWSPDGAWIYYASNRTGRYEVWKSTPDGKKEEQVTSDGGNMPRLSANGEWLYFGRYLQKGIWRSRLGSSAVELVPGTEAAESGHGFQVTAAGIFFVAFDGNWQIRRIDLATGASRVLRTASLGPVMGLDVDPVEKSLFYGWQDREEHELMMVEGFH